MSPKILECPGRFPEGRGQSIPLNEYRYDGAGQSQRSVGKTYAHLVGDIKSNFNTFDEFQASHLIS